MIESFSEVLLNKFLLDEKYSNLWWKGQSRHISKSFSWYGSNKVDAYNSGHNIYLWHSKTYLVKDICPVI